MHGATADEPREAGWPPAPSVRQPCGGAQLTRARAGTHVARVRGALIGTMIAAVLHPAPAVAFPTGETLHSGKQGVTCNVCHSGGVAPSVSFSGPTELAVGATGTYHFEVESMAAKQKAAGFNVAASDGTLAVVPDQDEQLIGNELTHTMPQDNVNMVAGWDFTWTAPSAAGTYTLFGAGNSVNLNGLPTGDRASATTFMVMVDADASTPTPTATPLPATATPVVSQPPGDTPTVGTPGGLPPCVGDCLGTGMVEVNELIIGVNIALGNQSVAACRAFDANGDGMVSINELIAAVNAALDGCS